MAAIVIDLGKVDRKSAKALKKGDGPLVQEVSQAIDAAKSKLAAESGGKMFVPVVVLYEKTAEVTFNPLLLPWIKR